MSKAKKNENLSFEQGLEKLEALVEEMESGDLPLEELLKKYESGSALVKKCEAKLKEAELKIQKLRNADDENPEFEDFDPDNQ